MKVVGRLVQLALAVVTIWLATMWTVALLEDSGWPGGEVAPEMVFIIAGGWAFLFIWTCASLHPKRRRR